ncbi:PleD family two-component system response regulator [Erythrobacter sp. 3-20A1M]|uniref:response regulator n=2 Tax=unclassified Erythrobacter TaxID=2633097 RepID=UPI001BFC0F00|nr:response regulator [Erythrobacter sp. 3-20A1M]
MHRLVAVLSIPVVMLTSSGIAGKGPSMALILYAEDDPIMGEIVRAALGKAGHVVGVVGDGKAALASLRFRRPALLILDMNMPGVGGAEVLDYVRRDPDLYDLSVLILTARQSASDEEITLRAGATDYLKKPVDPDKLAVTVDMILMRDEARRG